MKPYSPGFGIGQGSKPRYCSSIRVQPAAASGPGPWAPSSLQRLCLFGFGVGTSLLDVHRCKKVMKDTQLATKKDAVVARAAWLLQLKNKKVSFSLYSLRSRVLAMWLICTRRRAMKYTCNYRFPAVLYLSVNSQLGHVCFLLFSPLYFWTLSLFSKTTKWIHNSICREETSLRFFTLSRNFAIILGCLAKSKALLIIIK